MATVPPDAFSNSGGLGVVVRPSSERGVNAADTVAYFRGQLAAGAPWHRSLLEAMGRWTLPEEQWHGRRCKYIIGREAFDWLLLAERLCSEALDDIPAEELEMLLFHGILPEPIEDDEFRNLLGPSKHQGFLNYHYGVVLEEALQLAAEEKIRKYHTAKGYTDSEDLMEDAFRHLYNNSLSNLMDEFRDHVAADRRRGLSLTDLKEFTYWLHKKRVNYWDPARVASDTRLAIRRYTALQETAFSFYLSR